MANVWDTVSTTVLLPRMFPPTDFRIELISMDLFYNKFTYYT